MRQFIMTLVLGSMLLSCKSKDSKIKETIGSDTTVAKGAYNFEKHGDITVFIEDLSKAEAAGDKMAIAQMTCFPFVDQWPQFATGNEKDSSGIASLAAVDLAEFIVKFDN